MRISDYAIKHPAVIGIILISLALFGLLSAGGMGRELLSNIDMPEILVFSVYPGASPEVVERDVTDVLEEELTLISDVRRLSSESHDGYSLIFVSLNWNADKEAKKNDVRDKIANVSASLPEGLSGTPRVFELGTSSLPIYTCTIESSMEDSLLARYLEEDVVPRFSRIPDVSAVYARGVEEPAVRVTLSPEALESSGLTALEVYGALKRAQASVPAGDVRVGPDRLSLQSSGDFETIHDIGQQSVGYGDEGTPIRVGDLARINMGTMDAEFRVLSQGGSGVALDLLKRPGGDTEALIQAAQKLQKQIEEESGGAVHFTPVLDDAQTISLTLSSVAQSAWVGGLLAVLVLLLFLHDFRAAFVVSLCIPFTVMVVFILMRARGMTLNMMTLAGIMVSVGMMVDSSIVILENTVRHRQFGLDPQAAASKGAGEVGGAVLASTTTSISVFLPILFLPGLVGAILEDVSWVLVFSLGASAITAVIIVPWLASRILGDESHQARGWFGRFGVKFDAFFEALARRYRHALSVALNRKTYVILFACITILASLGVMALVGGEFMSFPDMNELEMSIRFPAGFALEDTESKLAEIAQVVRREVPEIEADLWYAGLKDAAAIIDQGNPSTGYGRIRLIRAKERERSVFTIVNELNRILATEIPDADIAVRNGGLAKKLNYATEGAGFRVELTGSSWDDVLESAQAVEALIQKDPLVTKTELDVRLDRELLSLNLDREQMNRLAVNAAHAGMNLRILFAGEKVGNLRDDDVTYPVLLDSEFLNRRWEEGIEGRIQVRNGAGDAIPYTAFSRTQRQSTADRIPRVDRLPSITVEGLLSDSDLTAVRGRLLPQLESANFPSGVEWRIAGAADLMGNTFRDLGMALAVSVFLVYAVMVVQFERFAQPFIIMGAVPFVLIGVALALAAFGTRVTMMSLFGVIALGGMVVNNAIVLVDFTNQRRSDGLGIREALLEASQIRLKPILMTTLTTLLGLIPLAFAMGEGSQIYAPLGQVIGGGLLTSTLITLFLVPILYEILEQRRDRRKSSGHGRHASALVLFFLLGGLVAPPFALDAQENQSSSTPESWDVNHLMARALEQDPELLSLMAESEAARAQWKGAKAEWGPRLSVDVGTSYVSDPFLVVEPGALGTIPSPPPMPSVQLPGERLELGGKTNDFRYDAKVVLEQPLLTWGKISGAVKAADGGRRAAQWLQAARERDLRVGITSGMESLALVEMMLNVVNEQRQLGDRLIELTKENFEEGFLLETEYRETRDRLQQILLAKTALEKERRDLLLGLERITGIVHLEETNLILPTVSLDFALYSLPSVEELSARILGENFEVLALAAAEDAARGEFSMARGQALGKPDIALRGEFGYGGGYGREPDHLDGTWIVTLGAQTTVFDSGRSRNSIRAAESRLRSATQKREAGQRQIIAHLKSLLYSLNLHQQNIEYYQSLEETDAARAAENRLSWESGYGREEAWLLAELDQMEAQLKEQREWLLYLQEDRQARGITGLL
ncbi:MAG: efflux RND transporter permease subunit [Spirochaetales bacterium]|nr:efflux RND transporter permease subunit [Spirochaetales bacterium]